MSNPRGDMSNPADTRRKAISHGVLDMYTIAKSRDFVGKPNCLKRIFYHILMFWVMRVFFVLSLALGMVHAKSTAQQPLKTTQTDHLQHARELLAKYPLIDTHVDTPQVLRVLSSHPLDMIDKFNTGLPGQFDIPRAREGGLGG
ncbi:hypothetical protein M231_00728 [Tremella mesenterica]|uniref:Membrane dipeptidase n=1 Tax=Tremella mesenterica TaxID=5217 RepID=A0A4V1M4Y7_TREME|nr:hypothetical protein M231_00728 [Tremella mesenterica]